jgi:phage recombination protein Bet
MTTKKSTTAVTVRQENQVATSTQGHSVLASMASRYHTDSGKLLETLKQTAFKGSTTEQLMALCIVADQYRLNPFTKEIYAFPDTKSGGIIPVVGYDGWLRIINDHPMMDGMKIDGDDTQCTVSIYRKDRTHPTTITEYTSECKRNTGPWNQSPARMIRNRAISQCGRIAFGFALRDPDEAEFIVEAQVSEARPSIAPPRVIEVEPDETTDAQPESPAQPAPADADLDNLM